MKTEGLRGATVRRAFFVACVAATFATIAPAASADSSSSDGFEGYSLGEPLGQGGWTANHIGGYEAANFDVEIVDPSAVWGSTLGSRALRLSNGVTSNGYGNQLQSPSLVDAAGESTALGGTLAGGTRQSRLSGSFTFASATQAYQPGLAMSFAPDRGDGPRMSNFRIVDTVGGMEVQVGTVEDDGETFVSTTIATGLAHDEVHTLNFTLDFVEGPDNDVLWLSVNGGCVSYGSSGSWEAYHRNPSVNNPPATFPADSILMRLSGAAVPANLGNGILFDTFDLTSSTVPAMPAPGVPVVTAAPAAAAVGQHVDVSLPGVATNACQPVTEYTATLTPEGGGTPIVLTSATPEFDFDGVAPGVYSATVSAANVAGSSVASDAASVTVTAPLDGGPDPVDPDPADPEGEGDPEDELAETGPTQVPLALLAAALVVAGFVVRRRAV